MSQIWSTRTRPFVPPLTSTPQLTLYALNQMASKTSNEGKSAGSKTNLVKKLTKNVIKEVNFQLTSWRKTKSILTSPLFLFFTQMAKLRYREWFTTAEIDLFRDNADTSRLQPLFERFQDNMEACLMKHARNNGLDTPEELIDALTEARAENPEEWKTLNNLIDSMTEKELFYSMMQGRAERSAAKLSKK